MNWKLFLTSNLLVFLITGCTTPAPENVTIAVAASSADVFKELETLYEKETSTQIAIISGSSGKLATQIESGAPFDIFLAADSSFIYSLAEKGIIKDAGKSFTTNQLVVWSSSPISNLENTLTNASKISIANPELAPFGKVALEVLQQLNIPKEKLVFGSSIAQVNQYIANKSVDVAFTASSSKVQLLNEGFKEGYWLTLDKQLAQHIVCLNQNASTLAFYNFLFTEKANQIFKKHGFKP